MKRMYLQCLAVLLTLLASCEHKDLCMLHPHTPDVEVVFDWSQATDGTYPGSMTAFFFPLEGGNSERYDFSDIHGDTIRIRVGTYRVVCLNRDTEANLMANLHSWEDFEVYTRTTEELQGLGLRTVSAPRAEGAEDEPMRITPDKLWSDRLEYVHIGEEAGQRVVLYPKVSVCTYTFEVKQVKHLKYSTGMSASLTGMSGSFQVAANRHSDISTLSFEVGHDGESRISGQFYTFFHCATERTVAHNLVLYVTMSDGGKYYYTFDVTEQVHQAPDPYHVHIVIDQLSLPEPITDDSGFRPTVDDWESEDIELNM